MESTSIILACWALLCSPPSADAPLPSARVPGQPAPRSLPSADAPLPSARVPGQPTPRSLPSSDAPISPRAVPRSEPDQQSPAAPVIDSPDIPAPPPTPPPLMKPDVIITENDFGKTVQVKPGSIVEVRLRRAGSLAWALDSPQRAVRSIAPFRTMDPKELPETDPTQSETLGGPSWSKAQFKVEAKSDSRVPLSILYSELGQLKLTTDKLKERLIPKPDVNAFRIESKSPECAYQEGTVYYVTLDVKE